MFIGVYRINGKLFTAEPPWKILNVNKFWIANSLFHYGRRRVTR